MAITLPALLILAGVVFVLCRYAGLRVFHALICILLGFYLASSSFGPEISGLVTGLIRLIP